MNDFSSNTLQDGFNLTYSFGWHFQTFTCTLSWQNGPRWRRIKVFVDFFWARKYKLNFFSKASSVDLAHQNMAYSKALVKFLALIRVPRGPQVSLLGNYSNNYCDFTLCNIQGQIQKIQKEGAKRVLVRIIVPLPPPPTPISPKMKKFTFVYIKREAFQNKINEKKTLIAQYHSKEGFFFSTTTFSKDKK